MSCEDELGPDNWRDTRREVMGILADQRETLSRGPLSAQQLQEAVGIISHLRSAWNRSWLDPLVRAETSVVRTHFARVFSIDPAQSEALQYKAILHRVLPTGYFEGKSDNQGFRIELAAMSFLVAYDHATRADKGWELDFSKLVNSGPADE